MRKNDCLFNKIKGGIYHSTSIEGYKGIRNSGFIFPNDGRFKFSHGQTPHSCCHKLKAISLLDLKNPLGPLFPKQGPSNWTGFLNNHKPVTILLEIEEAKLIERPKNYTDLMDVHRRKEIFVAEAEVCYPHSIPITAIKRCVLVCAANRKFFRILLGDLLSDEFIEQTKEIFQKKLEKAGWKDPFPWSTLQTDDLPLANGNA